MQIVAIYLAARHVLVPFHSEYISIQRASEGAGMIELPLTTI